MRGRKAPLLALAICAFLVGSSSAAFLQEFQVTWAGSNGNNVIATGAGNGVQLRLDPSGGATFSSYQNYLFGSFSTSLKLVHGDSAGTVCAFFLSSSGSKQDEIDFEFLGNASGQPYKLHTNLFVGGAGGREQQIILWFDPTKDFHTYTVVWNSNRVTWYVDNTPIRIFKNIPAASYPSNTPMAAIGTIYDASTWATEGGRIPINYKYSPFIITYEDFSFSGCKTTGSTVAACKTNLEKNWWEASKYVSLSAHEINELRNVQQHYTTYNYCTDKTRFATPPSECAANTV